MDLAIIAAKQVLQLLLMHPAALRPGADGGTVKHGLPGPQRFRKHLLAFKRRG